MNDERLDREIRELLLRDDPGPVPQALRARVDAIADRPAARGGALPGRSRALAAVAAVVALAVVGAALAVGIGVHNLTVAPQPSGRGPFATAPASPAPSGSGVVRAGLIDATHGWAVAGGRLLMTEDGGTVWTDVTPPDGFGTGAPAPLGVAFVDASHGWVAVNEPFTAPTDESYGRVDVWRTDDGGTTWSKVRLPKAVVNAYGEVMGRVEFDFLDAAHGFAAIVGGMGTGYDSDLYWTEDGGRTWSADRPATTAGADSGLSGGIAFASANDGLILGGAPGNRVFSTHDGGLTWARFTVPAPPGFDDTQAQFRDATFFDDRNGVMPVRYQGDGTSAVRIFRTVDAGRTWTVAATLSDPAGPSLAFLDADHWIAVGSDVRRTDDGGRTWRRTSATGPWSFDYLHFVDANTAWGIQPGLAQIDLTTDGGESWRQLEVVRYPPWPTPTPSSREPAHTPPAPSATAAGPTPAAAGDLVLPPGATRALPPDTFAIAGGRAFTSTSTGGIALTSTLAVVDLATGTRTVLAALPTGHEAVDPSVAGDRVVFLEAWHAAPPSACSGVPCNVYGDQPWLWRVVSVSTTDGTRKVLASGQNRVTAVMGEAAGPVPPVLGANGDRVAYTVEAPRADAPDATDVVVRSISTGAVVRTIHTAGYVAQVSVSGTALAYRDVPDTNGPGGIFPLDANLMVVRSDAEAPVLVAPHVSHVVLDGNLVAWAREDATDASIWRAPLATLVPEQVPGPPVTVGPGQPGPVSALAVAGAAVAWIVQFQDAQGIGTSELAAWEPEWPTPRIVTSQHGPDDVLFGNMPFDPVLAWHEYVAPTGQPEWQAISLADLAAAK